MYTVVLLLLLIASIALLSNTSLSTLQNKREGMRSLQINIPQEGSLTTFRFIEEDIEEIRVERYALSQILSSPSEFEQKIRDKCVEFGCNPTQIIRIMYCESTANPYAENGRYKGLFQHDVYQWDYRAARAGLPGASIFDPYAQIHVTTGMFALGLDELWECK